MNTLIYIYIFKQSNTFIAFAPTASMLAAICVINKVRCPCALRSGYPKLAELFYMPMMPLNNYCEVTALRVFISFTYSNPVRLKAIWFLRERTTRLLQQELLAFVSARRKHVSKFCYFHVKQVLSWLTEFLYRGNLK